MEYLQPIASTGSGTQCPLLWDNTIGGTGASEICRFEWTTKTITISADGNVDISWTNPTTGFVYTQNFTFSLTASDTPVAGTDWSVLEPNDIVNGGRTFNATTTTTQTTVLPWGPTATVSFTLTVSIGGFNPPTAAVDTTSFTKYTKEMILSLQVFPDNSGTNWVLSSWNTPGTWPFFQSVSAFHGSVDLFTDTGLTGTTGTISSFNLSVTDTFVQPPPI